MRAKGHLLRSAAGLAAARQLGSWAAGQLGRQAGRQAGKVTNQPCVPTWQVAILWPTDLPCSPHALQEILQNLLRLSQLLCRQGGPLIIVLFLLLLLLLLRALCTLPRCGCS